MTVRELADWLLGLQVWQALLLWMIAAFAAAFFGAFFEAAGRDFARWWRLRRHGVRKGRP